MGIIQEIKTNLQIGAPKLHPVQKNLEIHRGTDAIYVRVQLDGGQHGTHVREMQYQLWAYQKDEHGHEAYAVHTQVTHANDEQGWDVKPKERLPITRMLELRNPAADDRPLLIEVTTETGQGADNPRTQIELHLI